MEQGGQIMGISVNPSNMDHNTVFYPYYQIISSPWIFFFHL